MSAAPGAGRGLAACSWGPGRLDLFRVADDGTLRHRAEIAGAWTDEEDLGGTCASAPAAVTWAPDAMEVFAIFPDGALWNRYWDGTSWHPWESLGGSLDPAAVPAAASWVRIGSRSLPVGPMARRGTAGGTDRAGWPGSGYPPDRRREGREIRPISRR